MGDHQGRAPAHQLEEARHDLRLALHVEGARRLVHEQDRRVLQERPRQVDALPLAHAQACAPVADHRPVLLGQPLDQVMGPGGAGRRLDLLHGGLGLSVGDVLGHGRGQDDRLLQDEGDLGPQVLQAEVTQVDALQEHRPVHGVEEPRQEVEERRLAGTARADDGSRGPGRELEADVTQDRPPVVREGHVVIGDVAIHRQRQRRRARRRAGGDDLLRRGGVKRPPHRRRAPGRPSAPPVDP